MQSPEERIAAPPLAGPIYQLRLYVAGQTPKSVLACKNLKQICEEHLLGRYENSRRPMQGKAAPGGDGSASESVSLTPRELDILSLVSQSMSNKRIALTLNISVDTVKWNLRNILIKLRLSSRYDAMNWARKRGLIK